jgi:hypothetical protein
MSVLGEGLPWDFSDEMTWQDGYVYCPVESKGIKRHKITDTNHCPYALERLLTNDQDRL